MSDEFHNDQQRQKYAAAAAKSSTGKISSFLLSMKWGNWAPNFASSSLQGSGHFFLSAGEKVASERTENRRGSSMDVKRRLFLASGSLKCSPGGRQEEA